MQFPEDWQLYCNVLIKKCTY